ncbi:MAG: hypothetical protein KBC88_06215 [Alphaproteobacteria bacterium]|nr:hypothetical protein [Alphaproteobacteria bacterium]
MAGEDKGNKDGLSCVVDRSDKYPAEYQARVVDAAGKVVVSSPVVADHSLTGGVGTMFRGAASLLRPSGDEILPAKFGTFTGDALMPAGSVPIGAATKRLDGFNVDFEQNVCDVTGPQGQKFSAEISKPAPYAAPKP